MSMGQVFDDTASQRLEAVYLTADIVRQRKEVLAALALQPGETVLDVGSGPGLLMADVADLVGPEGHVTGIDASDSMLALSRRRFADPPLRERTSVLKADATQLPFKTGQFDAAVSTQVYEYVPDVDRALAELYRVLRPGGRALILDTDWDSLVWNTLDSSLRDRFIDAWIKRFAHPHLPRTLRQRLRNAGFRGLRCDVLVLLNDTYDPDSYSLRNGDIMANFVQQHGLSASDVAAWKHSLEELGTQGLYFFSLNRYLFQATKP
jgi:ubiquinone/menaquinone biosynthesis C-methylase UbiE